MNVLYLYPGVIDPTKGGVQRVTHVISNYLRNQGHVVYYLGLQNSDSPYQLTCPQQSAKSPINLAYIRQMVKVYHIDVVIFQAGISSLYADWGYVAKEAGAKLISCIHNSLLGSVDNIEGMCYPKFARFHCQFLLPILSSRWIKNVIKKVYILKKRHHYSKLLNQSDKVVLLSDKFKTDLAQFVNIDDYVQKICAIPNPVSFEKSSRPSVKEKRVLYVGRIDDRHKRVDLLLQIWKIVAKDKKDWALDIVGDGPFLNAAKRIVQQQEIPNVNFYGFCDPQPFYNRSSIFCMTSASEGFGIVLIEAMLAGVVPMAFKSYPSVTDIIDDGQSGLLVSPFDVEEYAEKLKSLMTDEEKLNKMVNSAVKKANLFSVDIIGDKWISLLNNL